MPQDSNTVTVVWGQETFFPVKYNGFTVGPFTMTTAVKADETPAQAMMRAWVELEAFATKMYIQKRNGYHERYGAKG